MSDLVRPMLATAGPLPAGPEWAFEFDWDGVRSLACSQPGRMRLFSSTHRSISAAYPELEAFAGRRRQSTRATSLGFTGSRDGITPEQGTGFPRDQRIKARNAKASVSPVLTRPSTLQYYPFTSPPSPQ